jgi:hypothetical protein
MGESANDQPAASAAGGVRLSYLTDARSVLPTVSGRSDNDRNTSSQRRLRVPLSTETARRTVRFGKLAFQTRSVFATLGERNFTTRWSET